MTGTTLYFQEEGTNSQARRARGAGEENWRRRRRQGGARGGGRGGAGGAAQDRGRIRPQRPSQQDPLHVPWQRTVHLEVSDHLVTWNPKSPNTSDQVLDWSGPQSLGPFEGWRNNWRRGIPFCLRLFTLFCVVYISVKDVWVNDVNLDIDIDFHAYTFLFVLKQRTRKLAVSFGCIAKVR